MPLSPAHRQRLAACLTELRTSRIPIDMPRIERTLIALLDAALADGPRPDAAPGEAAAEGDGG